MKLLITHIAGLILQANGPVAGQQIQLLEGSIFIPSVCIIMLLVIIAGIAITAQKNKH